MTTRPLRPDKLHRDIQKASEDLARAVLAGRADEARRKAIELEDARKLREAKNNARLGYR